MKEHPDYKYRPRRKPKPLSQGGGSNSSKKDTAKFSFPLPVPLLPPGFDPCSFSAMARSLFAAPPPVSMTAGYPGHAAAALNAQAHNLSPPCSTDVATAQRGPLVSSLAPAVAFSHHDLAALFCMQQKSHYEKLLREQQEVIETRRESSSSSIDDSKGNHDFREPRS